LGGVRLREPEDEEGEGKCWSFLLLPPAAVPNTKKSPKQIEAPGFCRGGGKKGPKKERGSSQRADGPIVEDEREVVLVVSLCFRCVVLWGWPKGGSLDCPRGVRVGCGGSCEGEVGCAGVLEQGREDRGKERGTGGDGCGSSKSMELKRRVHDEPKIGPRSGGGESCWIAAPSQKPERRSCEAPAGPPREKTGGDRPGGTQGQMSPRRRRKDYLEETGPPIVSLQPHLGQMGVPGGGE